MRGVNDVLAVEAMQAVSDAIRKDWNAAGLPASAANAITQNFDGLADALIEELDDIAALKTQPLPSLPVVSNIAYLGMYPDATMGALAIGALIELSDDADRRQCLFLGPDGAAMKLQHDGRTVQVIGPQAPLGQSLLGKQIGDEVTLRLASGMQLLEILSVD